MAADSKEAIAMSQCADAIQAVDEWLGQASTRQFAVDALWRARRALEAAGVPVSVRHEAGAGWRGSVFRALERCGLGWTGHEDQIRFRLAGQPNWADAAGPELGKWLEVCWRFVDLARGLMLERPGAYHWLEKPLEQILGSGIAKAGERPVICSKCGQATEANDADPA